MIYRFFKRLFDIILSLIALPFVLLILLIFAPIIYFSDKGPVFYNAPRLGYKGKVFKMYKLRSMKVNSPNLLNADGSTYNGENDPRVTKIGRFMRKTSIDEFPQFFNVLKGDMSFVGPRAHLTTNYKGYEHLDEKRKRRLDVRPGITGYNQAYFRNSAGSAQKLENDVYYAEHISLWLDIKIVFKTVFSVLKRENIYVNSETAGKLESASENKATPNVEMNEAEKTAAEDAKKEENIEVETK